MSRKQQQRAKQAEQAQSQVFARSASRAPRVRSGESPFTVWAGVAGATVAGVLVFNGLSDAREARAQTAPVRTTPVQPSTLATLAEARPAPMANVVAPPPPAAPAPAMIMPRTDPNDAYYRAPTLVVDLSTPEGPAAAAVAAGAPIPAPAPNEARGSADERFAARVAGSGVDVARATQLRDLTRTLPQGAVISAVLETAINSDLPGSVRGVVSRDVRSFDGARVLVPRGSRLIGQYKSAAAVGQTRAFVIWSRIITPEGVTVEVGSPASDRLGRGGLEGEVDTHFFRRFGASILLSVINAGASALANSGSGGDTVVIGSPGQANQVASIALQKQIDIPDTIKVAQGAAVQVFVARDLDFSAVVR